jgi:hypothetical protein
VALVARCVQLWAGDNVSEQIFESAKRDVDYSPGLLPDYAGEYLSMYLAAQHATINYLGLNPQAGSADLIAPRNIGGVPGDSLGSLTVGPNTARTRETTNLNTWFKRFNPQIPGPNNGGDDYGTRALMAYQASQIQAITQQESAAAIAGAR